MLVYFHGTTHPSLSSFEMCVPEFGECNQPVKGIWLSQHSDGAKKHASIVKSKRGAANAYIYKVTLKTCTKLSDATRSALPDNLFKNFRSTRPFFMRPFTNNKNWYSKFDRLANSALCRKNIGPADCATNRIIDLCLSSNIDGILNPVVSINRDGSVIGINEPMYGESLLLLNLQKVVSLELVETI